MTRTNTTRVLDALWRRGPWFIAWALFPFVLLFSVGTVSCKCEIGAVKGQVLLGFNLLIAALLLVGTIFGVNRYMIAVLLSVPFFVAEWVNAYSSAILGH